MCSHGLLVGCLDVCEDVGRFLKALLAFFLCSIATGLAFQAKHDVNIMMRQVTKHNGIVAFMSNAFTLTFTFMYLVNIGTTLYTLVGISCIREYIFRNRGDGDNKCQGLQCILGPLCATYQQGVVWLTLALQVLVSYGYVMFSFMLWILMSMCHSGHAVMNSFQGVLDTYHARNSYQANSFSPVNWIMNVNMEKYCHATEDLKASVKQVFVGCLLSVVSQSLMLMVVSEEKGRIEGTMAEASAPTSNSGKEKGKRGRSKRDRSLSFSSSSSSSSGSPRTNPLLHSNAGSSFSPPSGGRNYRLPGGSGARGLR